MRRRSPTATAATATRAVATALTAALAAAVLAACDPAATSTDGKATPGATTGAPATAAPATTPGAAPTSAPGTGRPIPGRTTATPAATRTAAPATTAPHARPTPHADAALMAVGSRGDRVRELQARLGQLHLFGRTPTGIYGTVTRRAVSDFQERHGRHATGRVDKSTWTEIRALTRPPTHKEMYPGAVGKPAARLDPRCLTGHAMCVSKTSRTLSWVVDGKVLATMDVRFGSQYSPTREGLFHVTFKSRNHVSTIYHTAMPYAMFFSGGEAVHYSSDFAARGYAGASHGCVNVRDKAAIAQLFDEVKVGDKVVVYW